MAEQAEPSSSIDLTDIAPPDQPSHQPAQQPSGIHTTGHRTLAEASAQPSVTDQHQAIDEPSLDQDAQEQDLHDQQQALDQAQTPLAGQGLQLEQTQTPDAGHSLQLEQVKKSGGRPKSFVWQYYNQISDAHNRSKRCRVECKACGTEFQSRVENMEAHLAYHCPKCEPDVRDMMRVRAAASKAAGKVKRDAASRDASLAISAMGVQAIIPPPAPLPKRLKSEDAREAHNAIPMRLRFPQVVVPAHPLVSHWLAVCRNKLSPPPIFRNAVAELGRILIYEAAGDWLPTVTGQVETPLGIADCTFVDPGKPVKVVPILRSGTVLLEQAATVLPSSETYHIGFLHDTATMQANMYLNKLPARFAADDRILLCDPMIATGSTCLNVLTELVARGASQEYIRIITVLVASTALENVSKQFPGSRIFAAMIDAGLNEHGFIVPGLGDAGDRAFGTL